MSLTTHSKFYFGYDVNSLAQYIDFNEGAGDLFAEVEIGSYTLMDFLNACSDAMNSAGTQVYTIDVDRATRYVTISAPSNFELLTTSGSHFGTSLFSALGFTGADRTGSNSYTGNLPAGSSYSTQFILQKYISEKHQRGPAYGTVNKSASGRTETVTYGVENFVSMNIAYVTNKYFGPSSPIRYRASGVEDLEVFMQYLITKAPLEFMEDENDANTYISLVLESTPDDQKGLRYKLKEYYDKGLPGFFETGDLKFRVIQ